MEIETKKTEEFLSLLCSLKNADNIVAASKNQDIYDFLKQKAGYSFNLTVRRKVTALANLGYVDLIFEDNKLSKIRVMEGDWNPAKNSRTFPISTKKNQKSQRIFAIFVDYKNLEEGLGGSGPDLLKDFFWIENIINTYGIINCAYMFVPEHYVKREKVPVKQLTYLHHYNVIVCPRQFVEGGSITKDADRVDTQMISTALDLIEIGDKLTDIIIVTGDGDFHDLQAKAKRHQKMVTIISATDALSGRFIETMETDNLAIWQLS